MSSKFSNYLTIFNNLLNFFTVHLKLECNCSTGTYWNNYPTCNLEQKRLLNNIKTNRLYSSFIDIPARFFLASDQSGSRSLINGCARIRGFRKLHARKQEKYPDKSFCSSHFLFIKRKQCFFLVSNLYSISRKISCSLNLLRVTEKDICFWKLSK